MEYQTAFNIGLVIFNVMVGGAGFLGGWVLNNLTKSIDRLDGDVRKMPETYVSKTDYRVDITRIEKAIHDGFERVFDKIDGKADKR